jgi:hypothetical protein
LVVHRQQHPDLVGEALEEKEGEDGGGRLAGWAKLQHLREQH